MPLEIEVKQNGIVGVETFITHEDYLEIKGNVPAIYYYNDIENVTIERRGTLKKKNYIQLFLDDGYSKLPKSYEIVKDNGILEDFCNYVNKKSSERLPEVFPNSSFNTETPIRFQIGLTSVGKENAVMNVYDEGIQIFKDGRIVLLRYSQIQNVYEDHLHRIFINLRTTGSNPKTIYYFSKSLLHNNRVQNAIFFINNAIKEYEKMGNIEQLQVGPKKAVPSISKQQEEAQYSRYKCLLRDERSINFSREREEERTPCTVILKEKYLEIDKKSMFLGNESGNKRIYYQDILGIDYDSGWQNSIELTLIGAERVILDAADGRLAQLHYELSEKVNSIKESQNKYHSHGTSNADELMKWHQLYQQGVISHEEFLQKKRELL